MPSRNGFKRLTALSYPQTLAAHKQKARIAKDSNALNEDAYGLLFLVNLMVMAQRLNNTYR